MIESVRRERSAHVFMDVSWTHSSIPCGAAHHHPEINTGRSSAFVTGMIEMNSTSCAIKDGNANSDGGPERGANQQYRQWNTARPVGLQRRDESAMAPAVSGPGAGRVALCSLEHDLRIERAQRGQIT